MFYVNVDTQLFCKSPEEPKRSGEKPWFRHLEGKTFSVVFLHADGTALDLTGKEIVVAIDNNFSHSDAMISHPGQNSAMILDAKGLERRNFRSGRCLRFRTGSTSIRTERG